MVKYNLSIQHIQKPNTRKLLKICEIFSGGTPSTKNAKYWNGTIPWLSSGETRNNFITKTERKITLDGIKNSSTRLAKKNDVVVASAGQGHTRGQVSLCLIDTYVNQSVIVLRANTKIIHPKFLFYNLKSRYTELRKLSDAHSSRGSLPKNILITLDMILPPLIVQEKIGKILYDLDIKIENLQKQNKILEQIAQTVFKSWFVDFDEVTEFEDSELGEIPKGWTVISIDKMANFLNGLALQNYSPKNDKEFLPVIKIKELRQGITNSSDKSSTNIPKKYVVENGDVLFSWSGSLEVILWTSGRGALNQHLFKVTSTYPKWFYYFWVKKYLPEYRRIAEAKATTMGHIKREHLTNSFVVIPNTQVLQKMDQILNPIIEKIIQTNIESNNLSQIRGALLPKLMSGEIRV